MSADILMTQQGVFLASGRERAVGATEGCLAQSVRAAKLEEPCAQELSGFWKAFCGCC